MLSVLILAFSFGTIAAASTGQKPPLMQMVGGYMDQDASNPEYLDLAWNSTVTSAVNNQTNSDVAFVPVKVLSVRTQVVAGMNYDLKVQFGQSTCKKDTAVVSSSNCPVSANAPTKTYEIKIFTQPWTHTFEVTSIKEISS